MNISMNSRLVSHFLKRFTDNSVGFLKYRKSVRQCGCAAYSSFVNSDGNESQNEEEPPIRSLLDDAALGLGPVDEMDEDDEWLTSPYPHGSVINPKQSQALKSLRPQVNPDSTSIILFPGQGSQYIGMGAELLKFPAARDVFDAASEILKYDILKLMLKGPASKLNETKYCQPAVVVCSLAALEKLKEENPSALESCIATAGFSVGEITALTFAGVFNFSDCIKLVRARAEAMQLASQLSPGGMATVTYNHETKLKTALQKAREWCLDKGIEQPECRVANYLDPNMKVIAGHIEALKYLELNKSYFSIVDVKRIPNSIACHSNLMLPGVFHFKNKLKKLKIKEPLVPVHSNVDGCYYRNTNQIYHQLPKQIYKPIKWEQTMHILYERAKDSAFPQTIICGPRSSLKSYLSKVNLKAASNCEDLALNFLEPRYREYGIKRFKRIPVSGAFHTNLMKPAVEPFRAALKNVEISEPYCHVRSNVDGKRYLKLDHVLKKLPTQIYKPVLWEQLIHYLYKRPKDVPVPQTFTCGPGTSLKALLRNTNNRAACRCETITV